MSALPQSDAAVVAPLDEYFGAPIRRIRAAAASIDARPNWDVLVVARRGEGIDMAEFEGAPPTPLRKLAFARTDEELAALKGRFDVCLVCIRVTDEELLIKQIRERQLASVIVGWGWDNHHSRKRNLQIAPMTDLFLPAHHYCAPYLMSPHSILGSHIPLGSYQWSRRTAAALFVRHRDRPRDDALHGGYVAWNITQEREAFVRELIDGLSGHALRLLGGNGRNRYFGQGPEDRWLDWAGHKVGLILPFQKDLSTRFFDSLLTGQVPIVPVWCRDFDKVIDDATANALPVVRLAEESVPAVKQAWAEALARYDADGAAGAERRHRYAIENHHLIHRLAPICRQVRALAAPDARIEMRTGMGAVGPVLTGG
jgi:hypothetical protein